MNYTIKAYELIREEILKGQLVPGARLRVEHLMERYEIGRSPIREALSRLTGDNLVLSEKGRGFSVAEVSLDELWEITELRVILETKALRLSIEKGDDQWEGNILSSFHQLTKHETEKERSNIDKEWEKRHKNFHHNLIRGSNSPILLALCERMFDQSERYRRLSFNHSSKERRVVDEHKELMDAIISRDVELACLLLTSHIRNTSEIVEKSNIIKLKTCESSRYADN